MSEQQNLQVVQEFCGFQAGRRYGRVEYTCR
jgi:hypothetical protein